MDYSSLWDCSPMDREELFEPLRNPILAAENVKTQPLGYYDLDMVAKRAHELQGLTFLGLQTGRHKPLASST